MIYVREDIVVAAEFTHSRSTHPQTGPGLGDNIPVTRMLRIQVQGIFSGGDGLALQIGDRTQFYPNQNWDSEIVEAIKAGGSFQRGE